MSEYQYYEFLAIDRPLTEHEMGELRTISTRAHITPTSFVNHYEWGDLKARPIMMMEKYFDAFVYVANWGTHRFMLRVPGRLLDVKDVSPYAAENAIAVEIKGKHLIIDFMSDQEPEGDWEAGEGRLSSIIPLRADLLSGDLRCLYLGWLLGVQRGEIKDGALEPAVPPGLTKLSAPLKSLADFLRIDGDLIEVAARGSATEVGGSTEDGEFRRWIQSLPGTEKDDLFVRLAGGEDHHVRAELLQRFRRARRADPDGIDLKQRSVKELLVDAEERTNIRRREAAEREAKERARREKEEAAARERCLDELAKRQEEVWREVDALITTKQPQKYERAVALLKDLRDLAVRSTQQDAFRRRLAELRERHSKKSTLMARINRL
ncbi:MAG: hypothetical protein HY716_09140 [Planctomycetes bacterium]|nr:hypothetical protein [Planctomycetota bacterium]